MPLSEISPAPANLDGSVQQLQVWAQHTDVTLQELARSVTRLNNLLNQIVKLNGLKSTP